MTNAPCSLLRRDLSHGAARTEGLTITFPSTVCQSILVVGACTSRMRKHMMSCTRVIQTVPDSCYSLPCCMLAAVQCRKLLCQSPMETPSTNTIIPNDI